MDIPMNPTLKSEKPSLRMILAHWKTSLVYKIRRKETLQMLRMRKNSKKYLKISNKKQKNKREKIGLLIKRKILTLKRSKMKTHSWLKDLNSSVRLSSTIIIIVILQPKNYPRNNNVSFHLLILEIQSDPMFQIMKTQLKVQSCRCSMWGLNLILKQL